MDNQEDIEVVRKRMKPATVKKGDEEVDVVQEEDTETIVAVAGSEEMELSIARLLERIERFTQQVSELLESGKNLFKELSNEFEERMIIIHKEQIEKWQEEIYELRLVDASNEEANALLHNARFLLHQSAPM
ncbi:uncharacterized protein LOC122057684 [Macadamia integrifolia]|uniref:uncharacterized protein LOC122057684 n=1 Tax=Macadamia integrifolia TaxID=60698 RepID=UPI001C52BF7B|nr:uncharacterized protein LOC122057684 [Macadamia integrifolia]